MAKNGLRNGEETGLQRVSFKTRFKMANFRPIKKPGMGLERWKDEKTGKRTAKNGMTNPKKDRKERKDPF